MIAHGNFNLADGSLHSHGRNRQSGEWYHKPGTKPSDFHRDAPHVVPATPKKNGKVILIKKEK